MSAALTPALALTYLSELSADIRAAIVLDAAGEVLAVRRGEAPATGDDPPRTRDAAFAAAARDFLAEAPVVRVLTERGGAFGARDDRHGVVIATGPLALPRLAIHDVQHVLAALGGMPPQAPVSDASPASAEALLDTL
jgi:hypothetical protein